jgi:hypothetical protein
MVQAAAFFSHGGNFVWQSHGPKQLPGKFPFEVLVYFEESLDVGGFFSKFLIYPQ